MPPKGSKFILEHLKGRATDSTPEEIDFAFKAVDFIGVFMNQLDNWLLNYLEVQMFGVGDKFFLRLAARGRVRIDFETGSECVAITSSTPKGVLEFKLLELKDLGGAKYAGQQTMESIGERKSFNKRSK